MVIYIITNLVNGKVYVGQHQGTDLNRRWRQHVKAACAGSKLVFHGAIRKYGVEAFSVAQLAAALSKPELDERETHFIQQYRATDRAYGYNMTPGGQTGGMYGKKQTEHQKQRAREVQTGRKASIDTRRKMSVAAKNRACPESLRQKRQEFTKGNKNAEGMKHSNAFKARQGERVKNSRWLNNGKEDKLVRADDLSGYLNTGWNLGRIFHSRAPHSAKTREKLKASWARRKRNEDGKSDEN